jgi:hypothetical protein
MRKLGVDCGNTIFHEWNGKLLPGSLDTLQKISESGAFDEIYIVSKANTAARALFLLRLRSLKFWKRTGIPRKNLRFCRRHRDKAPICEKLGITDFIDDRIHVLSYISVEGKRYALNPKRKKDFKRHPDTVRSVTTVASWKELEELLLPAAAQR